MAYDKKKDVVLAEAWVLTEQRTRLKAKIVSYDGGEPKLALSRQWNTEQEMDAEPKWIFRKVGRITIQEHDAVVKWVATNMAIFLGPDADEAGAPDGLDDDASK